MQIVVFKREKKTIWTYDYVALLTFENQPSEFQDTETCNYNSLPILAIGWVEHLVQINIAQITLTLEAFQIYKST